MAGIALGVIVILVCLIYWLSKNPGSAKRLLFLITGIVTYICVYNVLSKPIIPAWDLFVALFAPIGTVLFLIDLVIWIKTGKIKF